MSELQKKNDINIHAGHRERMKERFLHDEGESMATHELLEMLLYYSIPRSNTNPTAHQLLDARGSLDEVLKSSVDELALVQGVGTSTAILLKLVNAIMRRVSLEERNLPKKYTNQKDIVDLTKAYFDRLSQERLYMLCFDDARQLLTCEMIAEGTVNAVAVNSQKMMRIAAIHNTAWVVLLHNHPSGDPEPSLDDLHATGRYAELFNCMGIQLVEHYIVAKGEYHPILQKKTAHFSKES